MYELIDQADRTVVCVRIEADIGEGENQELVDLIRQRARQAGSVRLLVVYDADPGLMGAESLYDNLRFAKLAHEGITKMAVIGSRGLHSTWIGLFGLFGALKTAYFDREQFEEALAWLKE